MRVLHRLTCWKCGRQCACVVRIETSMGTEYWCSDCAPPLLGGQGRDAPTDTGVWVACAVIFLAMLYSILLAAGIIR